MRDILKEIRKNVRNANLRFVYTEPTDKRILLAANRALKQKIIKPILVGNEKATKKAMLSIKISPYNFEIIDPKKSGKLKEYAKELLNLRKHKGLLKSEALNLMHQPNYFGTMMLYKGDADCLLSGASYTTAETLRPAFQIVKSKLVSSFFLMLSKDKSYLFADCGVVRLPTAEELSEIAITTANSAKKFKINPRIAMLSYSTKGSGSGGSVNLVKKATEIVKKKKPSLIVDGEMQLDAAIVPEVAKIKCPSSPIKGDANILIFPDLNSANIGCKLVERFAKTRALGPLLQGFSRHLNVLSRGCSAEDILDITAITVMDALSQKNGKTNS